MINPDEHLHKRAWGTEFEAAVDIRDNPTPHSNEAQARLATRPLTGNEIAFLIGRCLPEDLLHIGQFYSNGSRIYNDHSHPEYSTPEMTTIDGVVAAEVAGERIFALMCMHARELGLNLPSDALHKRVLDASGHTWGYHVSHLLPRRQEGSSYGFEFTPECMEYPAWHAAVRPILVGAGAVLSDGSFALAQKILTAQTTYNLDTTRSKPLVNTRDMPHADKSKWVRLHDVSPDANMSYWATKMKIGMMYMVACLSIYGVSIPALQGRSGKLPQLALHTARDLTMRKPFELDDGSTILAQEVSEELHAACHRLNEREGCFTAEECWVLDEWEYSHGELNAYGGLDSGRPALLDRADYPIKYHVIEAARRKHYATHPNSEPPDTRLLMARDRMFDNLIPPEDGRGALGLKLRQTDWKEWGPDEKLVEHLMKHPPTDTRAFARGNFISAHGTQGHSHNLFAEAGNTQVDWEYVKTVSGQRIELDVLEPNNPGVDASILGAKLMRRYNELSQG